ncbi:2OG-Fe(II) oxygenase [Acidimangrovimonas sediminis]|uniref:2OG-Fe(II) oxygenase n=1 Tax=Acidimangrovimonas sediminis TaxID=2056283 RepID=UPI000C807796|nr:2OG-Fe(II) oxygenase [Acidimangrovimonas sediminis]
MLAIHAIPDAFTPAECRHIVDIAHAEEPAIAGLVGRRRDHNIRRAEIAWLDEREGAEWVMDRLIRLVAQANRDVFGFDLTEFAESAQVARYGAERQGHFGWHSDIGDGQVARRRKLTLVVQLSDPGAYTGGTLETWSGHEPVAADRTQGAAVLFPGFVLHRVTPVTEGQRSSLTVWAHGPEFR